MSQAEDLLNSLTEDEVAVYSVNPSAEPHIVINPDKTITVPEELKHVAVQGDHNIETVTFDCPRYWDGHDLSDMSMRIVYQRPDGHKEPHPVENLRVDETDTQMIHFDWTISGNVTLMKGNISFLVCAKLSTVEGIREREWHTRLNSDLVVDEGMDCSGDEIVEQNPDIIESILVRLDIAEQGGASDEQIAQAVTDYMSKHPVEKITEAELAAAIESYFLEHPVEGDNITEEELAAAIDAYFKSGGTVGGFVVQPEEPENKAVLWIDTDDEEGNSENPGSSQNVDLTGYAKEQWVKDNYQPKGEYLTEHQDISGKLDATALPTAIDAALAQAKANGEFDGQPGKTPVKGVDYWTESDQESIVQQVITALGTPVFGTVDADNNIILTGNLADGTYTLKYEDAGGEQTEIGTVEIGGPAYTNFANPTSADWLTDKRFSTSSISDFSGAYITNHIPCKPGDTIRMKGVDVVSNISSSPARTRMFDDGDSVGISDYYVKSLVENGHGSFDSVNDIYTFQLVDIDQNTGKPSGNDFSYTFDSIRQNFKLMDGYTVNDVVITVNEEIV